MPVRVLIVEDEGIIAMDVAMMLEEAGHAVVGIARTGPEALDLSQAHGPDIVLMDLNLGEGTRGDEAARAIFERQGIRSIFVSGSIDERTRADLIALNPAGMITKPMHPRVLLAAIDAALVAA